MRPRWARVEIEFIDLFKQFIACGLIGYFVGASVLAAIGALGRKILSFSVPHIFNLKAGLIIRAVSEEIGENFKVISEVVKASNFAGSAQTRPAASRFFIKGMYVPLLATMVTSSLRSALGFGGEVRSIKPHIFSHQSTVVGKYPRANKILRMERVAIRKMSSKGISQIIKRAAAKGRELTHSPAPRDSSLYVQKHPLPQRFLSSSMGWCWRYIYRDQSAFVYRA